MPSCACCTILSTHCLPMASFPLTPSVTTTPPELMTFAFVHGVHIPTMLSTPSTIAPSGRGMSYHRKFSVVTHSQHLNNHFLYIMSSLVLAQLNIFCYSLIIIFINFNFILFTKLTLSSISDLGALVLVFITILHSCVVFNTNYYSEVRMIDHHYN